MILYLLIIPLIGVLLLLPISSFSNVSAPDALKTDSKFYNRFYYLPVLEEHTAKSLMKKIALFASLLNLLISIYL